MKYPYAPAPTDAESRKQLNEKVLYLIDSDSCERCGITAADVFNAYTGDGGLHGLNCSEYDNYHDYSEAKKEIENGQFFTPPELCQLVAESLAPSNYDLVADLTCGKGSFLNALPVEANIYGCELDVKAFKVAQHLFPKANLQQCDLRAYKPEVRFDYVVGNPPFNLRWYEGSTLYLSQLYYCIKAAELLKPLGILALIVPQSFLADSFLDKSMIREMEERYSFIGQIGLPESAFSSLGVEKYKTKLQFWQKKSDLPEWAAHRYAEDLLYELSKGFSVEAEAERLRNGLLLLPKADLENNKAHIIMELARASSATKEFQYQTQKMLYQIKIHPLLRDRYMKCCEYVHRFYTQQKPPEMEWKEWDRTKLTEAKVLAYLRKVLQRQHPKPERDVIALVKRDHDFIYKGYSAKVRKTMTTDMKMPQPIYQVVLDGNFEKYPGYGRLLRRKQREYENQEQSFSEMPASAGIAAWLDQFTLWDAENEEFIKLNSRQRADVNLMLQKRYGLLQWEQGSGKTLAAIATGCYRMQQQGYQYVWVISSAISIRNNWDVVLKNYGLSYVFVEHLKDLERIQPGDYVLMTFDKLNLCRRHVKQWIKRHLKHTQLVMDESDEISNPSSVRAKASLSCFRRCRAKLLTTGTSTRNNISEFAPQLELMYNNSINMISYCRYVYSYDKDDGHVHSHNNAFFGHPIPAYKPGYSLFSSSHLPEKTTVFGISERNQDIYNSDVLSDILERTVITRTFEEIVGKDIRRLHQVPVQFGPAEFEVYKTVIKEFSTLQRNYFASTGNSRKDAMLKLMQQIMLLLRVSAAPNTLEEYAGDTPVKLMAAVDMAAHWENEIVAVGVRHKAVLDAYAEAFQTYLPERPLFICTGSSMSFAKRRALRKTLRESGNGILLCTQQSLPSSVNFEYVNKVIIPELHYNNARMSQFYMRFVRYNSTDYKDIYFLTYAGSLESNLMQMVLVKEKINLFMKGQDTDLDEIYEKFGVDYDILSLLMKREKDDEGHFEIRWGEQMIA